MAPECHFLNWLLFKFSKSFQLFISPKTLTGALISPFPFQDYRKMVDRLRITINWNHAGRSMTHSYYNFYLKFGFHCQFDRQKTAGYGLPDNKKELVHTKLYSCVFHEQTWLACFILAGGCYRRAVIWRVGCIHRLLHSL